MLILRKSPYSGADQPGGTAGVNRHEIMRVLVWQSSRGKFDDSGLPGVSIGTNQIVAIALTLCKSL